MPFFTAIERTDQLPALGTSIERAVSDWKAPGQVDPKKPFHMAKDVAAFANHLGGTLLIGACEADQTNTLARWEGMTKERIDEYVEAFSSAVRDRCDPAPAIDFQSIPLRDDRTKLALAVNVPPSLTLVGVRVDAHKPIEGYGGPSHVFPVRTGAQSKFLKPSELPMFMTPEVRRVAVLLARLPPSTRAKVVYATGLHEIDAIFMSVDEQKNEVLMRPMSWPATDRNPGYVIPLDGVRTVYAAPDGTWRIVLDRILSSV